MVVIKLQGGLGNQLFEYQGYQRLCEYYDDVYFDVDDYDLPFNKNFRRFDLDSFETIKLKFVMFSDNWKKQLRYKLCFKNIIVLPTSVKKNLKYIDLINLTSVETPDISSDLHQIPDNSYIVGYFSRERFISEWNKLFFYFNQSKLYKNKSLKQAANTLLSCNSVSVHFRRTDYLLNGYEKFQNICNDEYYKKAMDYIKTKIDNPIFYFFSDDIEWCKKHYKEENIRFIDSQFVKYNNNTVEDLFLMSCCKNNILANSTYSWWAGYFNKNTQKIIICPSKYNNEENSSEIFPKEWIRK